MHLNKILERQAAYVNFDKYENELQTIRHMHTMPSASKDNCRQLSLEWINSLNNNCRRNTSPSDIDYMRDLSDRFRNQGNAVFKRKNHNVLKAANLYTKAILTAPIGESLAIAHANRAVTLQEIGYYQAAYDDCMCALEHNFYPQHLLQKLITRQAFCAWKLANIEALRLHLDSLDGMPLSEHFQKNVGELHAGLEDLLNAQKSTIEKNVNLPIERKLYKVVTSDGPDGRHMIATEPISEGQLIFCERISTFAPVEDWCVCHHCATTQIVPFPCTACGSRVVYCSLKCRKSHETLHKYECPAYDKNIPANIGIGILTFKIFLKGLPELLPLVSDLKSPDQIWAAITGGGKVVQSDSIEYAQTLRMVTHLGKMTKRDIVGFALIAQLMVLYLKEYTTIFQLMKDTATSQTDWELVIGALLLRHIGQLIINGHAYVSVVPMKDKREYSEFSLLCHSLWNGPYHVKRGQLHRFSRYQQVAAINLPLLSICNHSCEQFIQTEFSGRYAKVYATKPIAAGEQIYNCYTPDCRKSIKSAVRRANLENNYNFTCECTQCKRANPDAECEEFHRYRCENPACRQVFVPNLPQASTLEWWMNEPESELNMVCTFCNAIQELEWYNNFERLLECVHERSIRYMLYDSFTYLDKWLMGYHKLKIHLSAQLIEECFHEFNSGIEFHINEFEKLGSIIRFYLRGLAEETRIEGLEYATKMTFLWDLIALEKIKVTREEVNEMLPAVERLSKEFKVIFLNYYKDYIEPLLD